MLNFQQKRKVRSIFYHRVTLIIFGIIVLFAIHSTWVVYKKKSNTEQMKEISATRVADLQARNTELQSQIDSLQTNSGIEAEIRSKFTVAKPDEHMVVVVLGQPPASTTPSVDDGFWQGLKTLFGKKKK